jgi:hypothetical protein
MKLKKLILHIAMVAHEINAAFCLAQGDTSQLPWDEAPQWQRDSAITGVKFHLKNPDASASSSHDSWMKEKVSDGWVYGELKDPVLKTHHCIVPFEDLPVMQQAKDFLFRQTVHSLKPKGYPQNKVEFNHVQSMIDSLTFQFARIGDSTTTVCEAFLPNGFSVGSGKSACVDPNNFDFELGCKYAKENSITEAKNTIWQLEGYLLKVAGKTSDRF